MGLAVGNREGQAPCSPGWLPDTLPRQSLGMGPWVPAVVGAWLAAGSAKARGSHRLCIPTLQPVNERPLPQMLVSLETGL